MSSLCQHTDRTRSPLTPRAPPQGVLLICFHILAIPILALVLTAFRGLFLAWFLEAWLRRVMHQPLMMRLLAMLALPVGQGLLVRFVYQYVPRSERLDR